jgi:hypothetical protein
MNARERALYRALTLWQANDNLRAVEAMEAITAEWPGDLLTAKFAEFLYYVLGQQHMGPALPRAYGSARSCAFRRSRFFRHGRFRERAVRRLPPC